MTSRPPKRASQRGAGRVRYKETPWDTYLRRLRVQIRGQTGRLDFLAHYVTKKQTRNLTPQRATAAGKQLPAHAAAARQPVSAPAQGLGTLVQSDRVLGTSTPQVGRCPRSHHSAPPWPTSPQSMAPG